MTGLEAIKKIKEINKEHSDIMWLDFYICIIEKELKAFELIIKKNVIIPKLTLTKFFDIKEYNKDLSERRQLTDEERTLILDVLKMIEEGK